MEYKVYKDYTNYLIGSDGFVYKVLDNQRGLRKLKGMPNSGGYRAVQLFRPGGKAVKGERWLVHRLVATLFIPNPDNLPYVDHIDTNTLNNAVENLRWVDPKGNANNPITIEHTTESQRKKYETPLVFIGDGIEIRCKDQYVAEQHFNCDRDIIMGALRNGDTFYGFSISQMEAWEKLH